MTTTTQINLAELRTGQQFILEQRRNNGAIANEEVARLSRHNDHQVTILRSAGDNVWSESTITWIDGKWIDHVGFEITARTEHTITVADLVAELTSHHDTDEHIDHAQQVIIERAITAGFLPTSETRLGEDFAEGVRNWWLYNVLI